MLKRFVWFNLLILLAVINSAIARNLTEVDEKLAQASIMAPYFSSHMTPAYFRDGMFLDSVAFISQPIWDQFNRPDIPDNLQLNGEFTMVSFFSSILGWLSRQGNPANQLRDAAQSNIEGLPDHEVPPEAKAELIRLMGIDFDSVLPENRQRVADLHPLGFVMEEGLNIADRGFHKNDILIIQATANRTGAISGILLSVIIHDDNGQEDCPDKHQCVDRTTYTKILGEDTLEVIETFQPNLQLSKKSMKARSFHFEPQPARGDEERRIYCLKGSSASQIMSCDGTYDEDNKYVVNAADYAKSLFYGMLGTKAEKRPEKVAQIKRQLDLKPVQLSHAY